MGRPPLAGGEADQQPPVIVDADRRRRQDMAEAVRNELSAPVAPDSDGGVGGAQVDPDDHGPRSLLVAARFYPARSRVKRERRRAATRPSDEMLGQRQIE